MVRVRVGVRARVRRRSRSRVRIRVKRKTQKDKARPRRKIDNNKADKQQNQRKKEVKRDTQDTETWADKDTDGLLKTRLDGKHNQEQKTGTDAVFQP
jgi:hypothetical protein